MKTRIVILGDSLSDFGNKKESTMGHVARGLKMMRTNEVGRFSDGENFADVLWKLTGGENLVHEDSSRTKALTTPHMSLENSTNGSPDGISFVNYAVGGAVAKASEGIVNRVALTTIGEQKRQYIKELDNESESKSKKPDTALHIIWIGLNDTVTDGKGPEKMEGLAAKISEMTEDIRKRVSKDGTKPLFLLVNNPNPQEAVRYSKNPNDPDVVKAKKATDKLNNYLENLCRDKSDMAIVDTSEMFNSETLHRLNILKASQNHGIPVQYEAEAHDKTHVTSLANNLLGLRNIYGGTPEGQEIFSEINPILNKALLKDHEMELHKSVGEIVIGKIVTSHNSEVLESIKDALLNTGTFPSKLEFALDYYEKTHSSQKHREEIRIMRDEIQNCKDNVLKHFNDDFNRSHESLYGEVERTLDSNNDKSSTYRKLIQEVAMNDFGFAATSDLVHPTQALSSVIALKVADSINTNFPNILGPKFESNIKSLYHDSNLPPNNPLNHLEEKTPVNRMSQFAKPINKSDSNDFNFQPETTIEKINGRNVRITKV